LDFGQTQLRLANIFVIFLWIGAEKLLWGRFFCGKWGAKAKRRGGEEQSFLQSEKQK
jgi:hypothetical protein